MGSLEVGDRNEHAVGGSGRRSRWSELRPGRSIWLFPTVVAAGWAVIVGLLGTAAWLTTSGEDRPSWREVVGGVAFNFALVFVGALALSLAVRVVSRRRGEERGEVGEPDAMPGEPAGDRGIWAWRLWGRPVMPTTPEGRWALVATLLIAVPFINGLAMFAAPLLLILAFRKGDRGLALILPLLVGVALIAFVALEFTVGHD